MYRFLVALLLVLPALNADAETFTVTRTNDPSPDGCLPGDCSLREAMEAADANDPSGEPDVILLPAGTLEVRSVWGVLPSVSQPLRVQGAGSQQTLIQNTQSHQTLFTTQEGGQLALVGLGLEVVFNGNIGSTISVDVGAVSWVTMTDVLVKEGHVIVEEGAAMEIRQSRLLDRLNTYGGDVLVEDSTLANLRQNGETSSATLRRVVLDNSLDPNPTPGVGGNVYVTVGTLLIEDSTIRNSSVYIDGTPATITLRRVHYSDNTGPIRTENASSLTIEDSLFEDNSVRALYAAGGAEWNVRGSSFVNNRVDGNAGGAIVLEDDTELRIENSTFSGNSFTVEAAADGARGAAIGFRNATGAQLILRHVTLVRPTFMPTGIVGTVIGGHGNGVTLDIGNTILHGTCGMNSSVLGNNSGNIESNGDTCWLDTEQNRVNVSSASLALGTLGDNGGATPTHLPAAGSLAIDRASAPQCLPTDQRGFRRHGGARCDVGAVEADSPDLFANGFE